MRDHRFSYTEKKRNPLHAMRTINSLAVQQWFNARIATLESCSHWQKR